MGKSNGNRSGKIQETSHREGKVAKYGGGLGERPDQCLESRLRGWLLKLSWVLAAGEEEGDREE